MTYMTTGGADALQELAVAGAQLDFYGVDNNCFKLGDAVYEALEDEDDGYRSYLRSINVTQTEGLIFFSQPLARVRVVVAGSEARFGWSPYEPRSSFYVLRDVVDGHVWLCIGTDGSDDYYPLFVFEYQPKGEA